MASKAVDTALRRTALRRTALATAVATAGGLLLGTIMAPGAAAGTAKMAVMEATTGATTGTATVSGSGFGHGVGLSQYGALGMARSGATAPQILTHFYTGVTVAPYRDDVDVRVNVVHGGTSVTLRSTAVAAGGGGLRLVPDGATAVSLDVDDAATLTRTGAGIAIVVTHADGAMSTVTATGLEVRWPGTRLLAGPATTLDVTSTSSSGRKVRSYRWGSLRITPVGQGLDAVAGLGLHDEYLRGVAEMPSSWPAAALQAQVVAARNYALVAARTSPRTSCGGCQLWDDTRSQVYSGWSKEAETRSGVRYGDRWVAAVAATEASATTSLAVLFDGKPVTTYFASSTGGRTRDPADVWGQPRPYLDSVADPWSADPAVNPSFAQWTRRVPVARLRTLFDLPDLVSVTVTARDSGGAAKTVTATSADGTQHSVGGNTLTRTLGLPGAWLGRVTLPAPQP